MCKIRVQLCTSSIKKPFKTSADYIGFIGFSKQKNPFH